MRVPKGTGSSCSALLVMESMARSVHWSWQSFMICVLCGCLKQWSAEKAPLLMLWFPLQAFTGINGLEPRAAVARCGAKGITDMGPSCFKTLLPPSPSIACTTKDRHGTLTECLINCVTLYFLTLQGNCVSHGPLSSICSCMTQSLWAVELRACPSLSQLPFLGCLLCPLFFLQQDIFLYWILHCKVRTMLQRGMIRQQGSRWPSMGNTGRGDQQSCTRGSLAALAAKQVPCVKGVSLSHLWEDSNQCCKTSSQILFGIRSMLGWSSDSLFKASFTLFIFISTKDTLLTSFSAI